MTSQERKALLLTARLLESGMPLDPPALGDEAGHVHVALTLAERLSSIAACPDQAREIIASLRAAAGPGEAPPPG